MNLSEIPLTTLNKLKTISSNIINYPGKAIYRKLKFTKKFVRSFLLNKPKVEKVLLSIGFVKDIEKGMFFFHPTTSIEQSKKILQIINKELDRRKRLSTNVKKVGSPKPRVRHYYPGIPVQSPVGRGKYYGGIPSRSLLGSSFSPGHFNPFGGNRKKKNFNPFQNPKDAKKRGKVLQTVCQNGGALQYASEELKNDKEIALASVSNEGDSLRFCSKKLRENIDVVTAAVKNNGNSLRFADDTLKDNEKIVYFAVKSKGSSLRYASIALKMNRNIVLEAVRNDGMSLEFSEYFQNDLEIVTTALRKNPLAIQFANNNLKKREDIMMEVVSCNGLALNYATDELKDNKKLVYMAVKNKGGAFNYASKDLKGNKKFVKKILKFPGAFLNASKEIREDINFVKENIGDIDFSKLGKLKGNRDTALAAVRRNGLLLKHIDKSLKNDRELVFEAIKQNPKAFRFAGILRGDFEIVFYAAQKDPSVLEYATELSIPKNMVSGGFLVEDRMKKLELEVQSLKEKCQEKDEKLKYVTELFIFERSLQTLKFKHFDLIIDKKNNRPIALGGAAMGKDGVQGVIYLVKRGERFLAMKIMLNLDGTKSTLIREQYVNKEFIYKMKPHPNLVRIHHCWIEQLSQDSLKKLCCPFFSNDRKFLKFLKGMCGAIMELKKCKIVHRDIKKENILYDSDNDIFLLSDFGVCLDLEDFKNWEVPTAMCCGGPPYYQPPELTSSRRKIQLNKWDIFSLGLVCYSLYSSEPPFKTKNGEEVRTRENYVDLDEKCSNDIIKNLIKKMLDVDFSRRYDEKQVLSSIEKHLKHY